MGRKNPTISTLGTMDHQSPHDKKLSEMHSALYTLGDKIRKPFARDGEKLLPKNLRAQEPKEARQARKHIDALHKAMMAEK